MAEPVARRDLGAHRHRLLWLIAAGRFACHTSDSSLCGNSSPAAASVHAGQNRKPHVPWPQNQQCAGAHLRKLSRDDQGNLVLNYRPWLVLPERTFTLPEGKYAVGKGLCFSEIDKLEGDGANIALLLRRATVRTRKNS